MAEQSVNQKESALLTALESELRTQPHPAFVDALFRVLIDTGLIDPSARAESLDNDGGFSGSAAGQGSPVPAGQQTPDLLALL